MTNRIGVAFAGAGGVVKSIHLPTLARLGGFDVIGFWDVNPAAARDAAAILGGQVFDTFDDLLNDGSVDILVVCTPAKFHAEHVVRGMRAGIRAVLCEKPLAATRDEARLIEEAAAETGVPLIVGTMHKFDPAWTALWGHVAEARGNALVRSSIVLPFNERFELWATEVGNRPAPGEPEGDLSQFLMHLGVMELAIHDLPLVRAFLTDNSSVKVTSASLVQPFGYSIALKAGEQLVDLFAFVHPGWAPAWELEAVSDSSAFHIVFPPSFLHAGSAVSTITAKDQSRVIGPMRQNGYEVEWETIRDLVGGKTVSIPSVSEVVADFNFALDIAQQSCALLAEAGRQ